MSISSKKIESRLRSAMKQQGTYSPAMEISISLAAGAYMGYLKAREDVEDLTNCCTTKKSREGHEYKAAHPEFRIMCDMAEVTRKALRELRLTRATIEGGADEDEVDRLIGKVNAEDDREE